MAASGLYANSLSAPFVFDDSREIVRKNDIRKIFPPRHYLSTRRGLVELTLALNYRWGRLDVRGYHLLNVAVHALNGLLIYALVLSTLQLPYFAGRYARHGPILATLVALAFIAHPLQTATVTYVIQRAEALGALFSLLALLLFLRGAAGTRRIPAGCAYAGAAMAVLLGLMAKAVVVTAPPVILFYDLCFVAAGDPRRVGRRWMVHALLFATLLYPLYLNAEFLLPQGAAAHAAAQVVAPPRTESAGTTTPPPRLRKDIPSAGLHVGNLTPGRYLATQFGVVTWYLRLFLLPTRLTFDYGWPMADSFLRTDVILPLLLLLAVAAAAVFTTRRYRLATFCLGWFFLLLAPSSSFLPLRDAAFEYRMYLPVAALAWLVIAGGRDGLARLATYRNTSPATVWRWGTALAACWLTLLGALTVARNRVYQHALTLHEDSARKAPHNWRPYYDLGIDLTELRRFDDAIAAYETAIRNDPTKGSPHIHLAQLLRSKGRLTEAEAHLKAATHAGERSVTAMASWQLGRMYMEQQRWDEARRALGTAVGLMPKWGIVHIDLARILARKKNWPEAAAHYTSGLRFSKHPRARWKAEASRAYDKLAMAHARRGEWNEAIDAMRHAVDSNSNDPRMGEHLGRAIEHKPLVPPAPG